MRAVFLDAHGVLLDFVGALSREHGVEIPRGRGDFANLLGMTDFQLWSGLNRYEFWRHAPVLPTGRTLYKCVAAVCDDIKIPVYVCTRPMLGSHPGVHGTFDLLMTEFKVPFAQIVVASDKAVCASGAFLVDDEESNVVRWRGHGGQAFHWPCHYNNLLNLSAFDVENAVSDAIADMLNWATDSRATDSRATDIR